jgi:hypothetical protein
VALKVRSTAPPTAASAIAPDGLRQPDIRFGKESATQCCEENWIAAVILAMGTEKPLRLPHFEHLGSFEKGLLSYPALDLSEPRQVQL